MNNNPSDFAISLSDSNDPDKTFMPYSKAEIKSFNSYLHYEGISMNIDGLKQMFSTLNSKELSEILVIIAQEIEKRMSK